MAEAETYTAFGGQSITSSRIQTQDLVLAKYHSYLYISFAIAYMSASTLSFYPSRNWSCLFVCTYSLLDQPRANIVPRLIWVWTVDGHDFDGDLDCRPDLLSPIKAQLVSVLTRSSGIADYRLLPTLQHPFRSNIHG